MMPQHVGPHAGFDDLRGQYRPAGAGFLRQLGSGEDGLGEFEEPVAIELFQAKAVADRRVVVETERLQRGGGLAMAAFAGGQNPPGQTGSGRRIGVERPDRWRRRNSGRSGRRSTAW